jgi:enoyl-[acyl-carrier protein] reductase I
MATRKPDWKANENLPVGKGATFQQWLASVGNDKLEMDVAPWGEGHLKINGRKIAHINDAKDRRQAFRNLNAIAERYLQEEAVEPASKRPSMIPAVKAKLLEGKRGLIVGIANENSIAWGCAKAFRALGAELAVTYLNEKAKKFVEPLARELEASIMMPLDVRRWRPPCAISQPSSAPRVSACMRFRRDRSRPGRPQAFPSSMHCSTGPKPRRRHAAS